MIDPPGVLAILAGLLASTAPAAGAPAVSARYVEVRGARLWVETLGEGPPILFLHGGARFFDSNFAKQRDDFAADHTVVGLDQRGHGHSPDGPWALSYALMAEDTAAVLEVLQLGPVDVVGHSDGGNVALLLARDHPGLVRRVVVSGANLRSGLTPDEARQRRESPPEELAAIVQARSDAMPPFFRSEYAAVSPDGADHWLALLQKCYLMWIDPVVIEPGDLARIAAPVLVMAGDQDFTSIEETTEIFRALPRGQLLILPGTGHGTFQQRPELANLAVRQFLEAPDPPAR